MKPFEKRPLKPNRPMRVIRPRHVKHPDTDELDEQHPLETPAVVKVCSCGRLHGGEKCTLGER